MPTPTPAASATGSLRCGTTAHPPSSVTAGSGHQHRRRQPVDAADRRTPRDRGAQARCRARTARRWRTPGRRRAARPRSWTSTSSVDAGDGEGQRGDVARRADAERGEHDHRQELDRRHRAERQARDRLVEAAVHDREHRAERHQQPDRVAVGPAQRAPRPAPERRIRPPRWRSAARPPRAASTRRTAARRRPGRGSGTRRSRRSRCGRNRASAREHRIVARDGLRRTWAIEGVMLIVPMKNGAVLDDDDLADHRRARDRRPHLVRGARPADRACPRRR